MSYPSSTLASLQSLTPFPDDFTRGVLAIPCHSHNDYWRHVPLLDAISAGCSSVEADIWVSAEQSQATNTSELYVGHSRGSLRPERTLKDMYIDPLLYILDQVNRPMANTPPANTSTGTVNGIFEANPNSTMVLLVDFKESPDNTNIWNFLQVQLQPLRDKQYLTYWNSTKTEKVMGPITIVATGDATLELVNNASTNPHRDIFFDAPLLELENDVNSSTPKYNSSNSYYASVDFSKAVGKVWFSLSHSQQMKIGKQASAASEAGLVSRYWDTPGWPVGIRNNIWGQLVAQGVGVLNVDELWTASKKDWRFCSAFGWGICP
ncbi:hypothetical protein BKA64DRAFT_756728 [Cadophora sp. MPI-SDFR-AT-0126]|nr:hypothetical protein BKA64DRAFT_756728 [Leotiomycetes sp. MPI-SDFR-AT-0126]